MGGGNDGAKAEHAGSIVNVLERWIAVEGARAGMLVGGDDAAHHEHGGVGLEASRNARVAELTAEVHNALYWDLAVPRDRVRVHCDHGWVTLTGAVERAYQRSAAEADVRRVPGVLRSHQRHHRLRGGSSAQRRRSRPLSVRDRGPLDKRPGFRH